MKTRFLLAAIAAGMTLAATAEAREANPPRMEMPAFEDLDINADGAVTSDEIEAAMQARDTARFAETDTNGDGVVTTSVDLNGDGQISTTLTDGEMLAWGEDDCVLWHQNLDTALPGENLVRAVAAQDVEGLDGTLQEFVWVGGYGTNQVAKLDGVTGEVLLVTVAPATPYGFATLSRQRLALSFLLS